MTKENEVFVGYEVRDGKFIAITAPLSEIDEEAPTESVSGISSREQISAEAEPDQLAQIQFLPKGAIYGR